MNRQRSAGTIIFFLAMLSPSWIANGEAVRPAVGRTIPSSPVQDAILPEALSNENAKVGLADIAAFVSWDSNGDGIADQCIPIDTERDTEGPRNGCGVADVCLSALETAPAPLNSNADDDAGHDNRIQVTTDGQGTWLAAWHSFDELGGMIGNDFDIIAARSFDNGANWTPVAALNDNAATDAGHDDKPQVTTDGAGNWLAVWTSYDTLAGTIGDDGDILFSRSINQGADWTPVAALNSNADSDAGNDDLAQLTTDGQGVWVAVWMSDDTLGGTIGADRDILFSRSLNNGSNWSPPAPLHNNAASDTGADFGPQLTTDGAGTWLAVWYSNNDLGGTLGTDFDIFFSRSTNQGESWTAPAPLNTNAGGDFGSDLDPQVSVDGMGNWLAVWGSNDELGASIGTDWDILVARSTNNGVDWTAPQPLNGNAATDIGDDWDPQVSTDGSGLWVAVWSSRDSLQGTIGIDEDILTAGSTDNGAHWSLPAPLGGNAWSDEGWDGFPQLTYDGIGHWLAAWSSEDSLGNTIGNDVDVLFAAPRFDLVGIDCDCNGVPDECELALGRTADWNANEVPDVCDRPGDFDGNLLVTLDDFGVLTACLTETCPTFCTPPLYSDPSCAFFDVIGDGDVDLNDFSSFQAAFGGP